MSYDHGHPRTPSLLRRTPAGAAPRVSGAVRGLLGALLLAAVLVGVSPTSGSAVAAGQQEGYIRAAHLVPDLPAMDVTLSRFSGAGTGTQTPVLTIKAAYGDVGSYAPVAAGFYAVALRPAGSPATAPPILATTVEVAAGGVYTAAGVGTATDARLTLFADDLSRPGAGSARVRVVNAARTAAPADVRVSDGTTVAAAAEYAVPSSYARVAAGQWNLTAASVGSTATPARGGADIDLSSGAVYTLLVLEGASGALRVSAVLDAAGSGVVPVGGAATGLGGSSDARPAAWPGGATAGAAMAVALTGLLGCIAGMFLLRRDRAAARHRAWSTRPA